MSHKINKNMKKTKKVDEVNHDMNNKSGYSRNSADANNNMGSISWDKISDEDKESLRLLTLQLKAILLDYYAETLFFNSTMQGIQYILEKYDNIEGNEHDTTLAPDIIALQSTQAFMAAKIMFTYVAFTRFNIVTKKKAEGTFNYSLQPNCDINTANILNLIVSYYYIRAAEGIVARDNTQPVFGI